MINNKYVLIVDDTTETIDITICFPYLIGGR